MDQLIRILNDEDRKALDWLRTHAGDVRVAAAARRLGGTGKPYLSAVCRYLGVWPPAPRREVRSDHECAVGDRYLAQIRQLLAQRAAAPTKHGA